MLTELACVAEVPEAAEAISDVLTELAESVDFDDFMLDEVLLTDKLELMPDSLLDIKPLEMNDVLPEDWIADEMLDALQADEFANDHLPEDFLSENIFELDVESDIKEVKDITKIKCRNEDLAGSKHPETNVPFERKQIEIDGEIVEVVVPEFESSFDVQLPDDLCDASDSVQFKECNRQLKEAIENDPELRSMFTDEQLEQIENGETPDGYTWHHDAEKGKMQLVDSETHMKTAHTGGRYIWGGGSDNR